jgi:hypothetical protein
MKMKFLFLLSACTVFLSCKKEVETLATAGDSQTTLSRPGTGFSARRVGDEVCAVPQSTYMAKFEDDEVKGSLITTNDDQFLFITVSADEPGMYVSDISVLYGAESYVNDPDLYTLDGAFINPQVKSETMETTSTFTVSIPLSAINGECVFLNVHSNFYSLDANGDKIIVPMKSKPSLESGRLPGGVLPGTFEYCLQFCPKADCGQLRTQTPGGWGAPARGNNPASYLYANFANAFPGGVVIGCTPDYNITFTSAEAITKFLPAGGKAAKLTNNFIDPTGMKNVLSGHLTALALSVGFDNYDDSFGQAGMKLGDMVIKSGAFAGYTVADFLEIANNTLGGCSNNFTIQQVLDTATSINENYVDGTRDNGFLVCPE